MADALADASPPDSSPILHSHRDVSGGWLRPTVFGMMDGLVSNLALIAGVAGASVSRTNIALAGLAGLVGGAFSMASGEYISVQSQNESTQAELDVERHELAHNADAELAELAQAYVDRGVDADLALEVARQLSRDPDQALLVHAQEELGIDPHALPNPWVAAASSLLAFAVGAFVPLLPYLLGASSIWLAAVLASVALFVAGVVTARFTNRTWAFSAARQLLIGLAAAAVTYGIGSLVGASVS